MGYVSTLVTTYNLHNPKAKEYRVGVTDTDVLFAAVKRLCKKMGLTYYDMATGDKTATGLNIRVHAFDKKNAMHHFDVKNVWIKRAAPGTPVPGGKQKKTPIIHIRKGASKTMCGKDLFSKSGAMLNVVNPEMGTKATCAACKKSMQSQKSGGPKNGNIQLSSFF